LDAIADEDKLDFFFQPFESKGFFKTLDLRVKEEGGFQINASELGEGLQNAMVLAIAKAGLKPCWSPG
jgi:putative ATP-dependent endonuclease of the OLD family